MDKKSRVLICKKCGQVIEYDKNNVIWDEGYCGCSAKLILCKKCGTPYVLKYVEDKWIKEKTI